MRYGSPFVDEMIAMLYTYPRIHVDIGGNTWPYPRTFFHAQLRKLIDAGFGNWIMCGSDQMVAVQPVPSFSSAAVSGIEAQKRGGAVVVAGRRARNQSLTGSRK